MTGCHPDHHLRVQLYMALLERRQEQAVGRVEEVARSVVHTLGLLDRGASKLRGRYMAIMLEAQERILREEEQKVEQALKQLAMAKMQAAKLCSDFCIEIK